MKFYDSKGLEVEITETDGGIKEGYVVAATYVKSGDDVADTELDYLTEAYAEAVFLSELDKAITASEWLYEGDR